MRQHPLLGMRRMTYEDALRLFRKGHFHELISTFKDSGRWRDGDLNLRVLSAYALALSGQTSLAASVITFEDQTLSATLRCQIESTRGIISWWSGDHESAAKHFPCAVQWARESRNAEWTAWAHLHLFRFA